MGMSRHHAQIVQSLPRAELALVKRALGARTTKEVVARDQADVVVLLLRQELLVPAVRLVGRPISVYPPSAMIGGNVPLPMPEPRLNLDDRKIVKVQRNPRLPTTDAFHRYRMLKPGITIRQFLARGGRRRDIHYALRRELISLSDGGRS